LDNNVSMERLFNLVFPPECIFCGRGGYSFCLSCLFSCSVITHPVCIVCKKKAIDGFTHPWCLGEGVPTHLFSCLIHVGKIVECFKRSKSGFKEFASLKDMAKYGAIYSWKTGLYYPYDFIMVSIPLTKKKKKERGFNQVDFVCDQLKKTYGLRKQNSILTRDENGFISNLELVKGKCVLLVDDYMVSGDTLLGASKALYAAGASEVKCFTLSMVL
jgi:predicted amidophosphoribosyltransferase